MSGTRRRPATPPASPAPWQPSIRCVDRPVSLATLNKAKRYPRPAQQQCRQGVPYIRFTMNRDGRVLSCVLERRSGSELLDEEAVALPRRAQPFPRPPDDVQPGQAIIELVVPVEFFRSRSR